MKKIFKITKQFFITLIVFTFITSVYYPSTVLARVDSGNSNQNQLDVLIDFSNISQTDTEEELRKILLKILMQLIEQLRVLQLENLSTNLSDSTDNDKSEDTDEDKDDDKKIVSEKAINIYTPVDGSAYQVNTILNWNWSTNDSQIDEVDIYLEDDDSVWEMAEDYPNNGQFWWTVGSQYSEWSKDINNGEYEIRVCPAGNKRTSSKCDSFSFEIYGDNPEFEIAKPEHGDDFEVGDTIDLKINDMQKGDRYVIQLSKPAKVSPKIITEMDITAQNSGVNYFEIQIPDSIPEYDHYVSDNNNDYMIEVFQWTNSGVKCVNVCAHDEVYNLKIRD